MKIIKIKNFDVTIIRELPETPYRQLDGNIQYRRNLEILCIHCKKPKSVGRSHLYMGYGIMHHECRNTFLGLQRRNKKLASLEGQLNYIAYRAFRMLRRAARVRNHKFLLVEEDIRKLIFSNCTYCNQEPNQTHSFYQIKFNGIDRVDSNIGYTQYNSVSCCGSCNKAKSDMSYEDFLDWIDRLATFNGYKRSISLLG